MITRLIDLCSNVKHQYKQKQATFKDISFSYTYHFLGQQRNRQGATAEAISSEPSLSLYTNIR